jgi:hypothetical protein
MISVSVKQAGQWKIDFPAGGLALPVSFFKTAAEILVRDIRGRMNRGVGANNQLMVDNAPNTRSAAGFAGQLGKFKKAGKYKGKELGERTGWKRKRPSVASGWLRDHVKIKEVTGKHAIIHIEDAPYPGDKYGTTTLMAANFLQVGTSAHTIAPRGPWLLRFPTTQGIVMAKRVKHPGTVPREFFGISPAFEKHMEKKIEEELNKIIGDVFK